jgi:hypothetical protein
MRGRRPDELTICSADESALERIAQSDARPWFRVRRARIVLGIAAGQRRETLAAELDCDETTIWRVCQRYRRFGLRGLLVDERQIHSGREPQITPVRRAKIFELACLERVAEGLHITHWSCNDLARQAVADRIFESISARTVQAILNDVDSKPHRARCCKPAQLDARFKERAERVLWCYGNAARLAEQGIWIVCVDEIANYPVADCKRHRRAITGSIGRKEFDCSSCGTANILVFLVVHTGVMELVFLEANDHQHYTRGLEFFRKQHQELRKIFLIQDSGLSHIAGETQRYFKTSRDWWQPCYTPANASWLNQAEILIHAFKHYCLTRASCQSQEAFKTRVLALWSEYNARFAHPFEWRWTNQMMRKWIARYAAGT